MASELFEMIRKSKAPRVPWAVLFLLGGVALFVSLMTFLHSGDVVLHCKREGEQPARCAVTSTSAGVLLSDEVFEGIAGAEIKDSGGKHPNLHILLQRKDGPGAFLEGSICGTGFGQRESCNRELGEMIERIRRFLADPSRPELKIQVAEDSSGALLFCSVAVVIAIVLIALGFRSKRRWRLYREARAEGESPAQ